MLFFNTDILQNMEQPKSSKDTLIYGIHSILEAINEGIPLNKVYIQKDIHNDRIREVIGKLKKQEIPFQLVPREKLNRLTMKQHQGIVAMSSPVEFESIENVLPQIFESGEIPVIAILDGITDVRNFGAIARSAECFGIQALVIPAKGGAMPNAEAMKTSAGALHKVKICREINFLRSLNYIKDSGLQLVACTEKATKQIADVDFSIPSAIVLGSEGVGIDPQLLELCEEKAKIPMVGEIQSLNVSVAAGIIFYEALRKRM